MRGRRIGGLGAAAADLFERARERIDAEPRSLAGGDDGLFVAPQLLGDVRHLGRDVERNQLDAVAVALDEIARLNPDAADLDGVAPLDDVGVRMTGRHAGRKELKPEPLDGGQISRELLIWASPQNGQRIALGLSFLLAAVIAVHCVMAVNGRPLITFLPIGSVYTAILFAMLAVESLMLLQQTGAQRRYHDEDEDPWGR